MEKVQFTSRKLNILSLLSEVQIEVPIIQRDYAQGREENSEVRTRFLETLYESVMNKDCLELDFIYGSIVNNKLQPLDGQQRLTTLFLLYWYAALKSGVKEEIKEVLSKFKYETRISARTFCEKITTEEIVISDNRKFSKQLIDSSWFFLSWKNDPTISAMLSMLDKIHEKFSNVDDIWNRLTDNKDLISFHYIELSDIGLTDELYIKMNARGKLLTPYENFKSVLQGRINDEGLESGVLYEDSFELLIDTKWTDLFWQECRVNYSVDKGFIKFIAWVDMINLSLSKSGSYTQKINNLHDKSESVRASDFDKSGVERLKQYLNFYHKYYVQKNVNLEISPNLEFWRHKPEKSFFTQISTEDKSASYSQKVLLFAQIEYFVNNESYNQEKYDEWMRVVRNIIARGSIDNKGKRPDIVRSPQAFSGAISLIKELVAGSSDIYSYLNSVESIKSSFAREQVSEEIRKAKLFNRSEKEEVNYKGLIHRLEDNNLLMGRVTFALECVDVSEEDAEFYNKLNAVAKVFDNFFYGEEALNADLRRAFLCSKYEDRYEFYTYWWSYWYAEEADKRCLINTYRELEYLTTAEVEKHYFIFLVRKLTCMSLSEIVNQFDEWDKMSSWQQKLIRDTSYLDNAKSHYIAISSSGCYLLKSQRPRTSEGSEFVEN